MMTAYVPSNSWGTNKLLLIRGIYQLILPSSGMPGSYDITEFVSITGANSFQLPTSPAFTPFGGTFTTMRYAQLIRIDPAIEILDFGDAMQKNWMNDYDAIEHAFPQSAIVPPFDYGSQITVSVDANLPSGYTGAQLSCIWCEAFLEQATNLGALA